MDVTTIFVAIIGSNALVKLIDVVADRLGKASPTKEALRAILYERLEYLGDTYINRGYITIRQHATYKSMYRSYKKLKGNTFIDDVWAEVDTLPRK